MFPFLIGKVLTDNPIFGLREWLEEFPFLIGKVLTINEVCDLYARFMFPFLIGKVLTEKRWEKS